MYAAQSAMLRGGENPYSTCHIMVVYICMWVLPLWCGRLLPWALRAMTALCYLFAPHIWDMVRFQGLCNVQQQFMLVPCY